MCYWPVIQVINFSFIKEQNRVPFVAMASFVWTIFLAYMKQIDAEDPNGPKLDVFDRIWSKLKPQVAIAE